jgi:hypothetical protein
MLARAACCGKNGCACAPKIQILVAKDDIPRVAQLLSQRWRDLLEREGTVDVEAPAAPKGELGEDEHPPCPACGTAAPLVAGACSDCGLQLE